MFAENVVDEGIGPKKAATLAAVQARKLESITQKIKESKVGGDFDWAAAIPRGMDVSDLDAVSRVVDKIIQQKTRTNGL